MRKVLKIIGLVLLLLSAVTAYQMFHYDNRYFADSTLYEDYQPLTDYEENYPVGDYVDERMNAFAILRSGVLGSMARYDQLVTQADGINSKFDIILDVFKDRSTFINYSQDHQYQEPKPITLKYVGEQDTHNFEYTGYLEDGTEVTGNLAIWGSVDNVLTAISFQDGNGHIDANKARLFADDSNAEMMAYLMIEAIQEYFGTSYEPNEAAIKFFNCAVENVAGSISYHATISLASLEANIGELTIEKVKTANISTVDEDGFLVNQPF